MDPRAKSILWLDGAAGCAAGLFVLALRTFLAELHRFPLGLVTFLGVVNLAYASYSGTLAIRASRGRTPSRLAIDVLVVANLAWVVVCASIVALHARTASIFGIAHVSFEAVFVGTLGIVEFFYVRPYARTA